MKSLCAFVLGVLVLAIACNPTEGAVSSQRRCSYWSWKDCPQLTTAEIPTQKPPSTPSIPTQKPTPSIPSTTPSEGQINLCIKTCPRTTQYSPVCATNDKTYHNIGTFKCAKQCGAGDIQIRFDRPCPPKNP